jgi:Uma2 family endonuclease
VERIVEEPRLVVEVTSRSTRATDRREKLEAYMRVPSLRLYLIVDQRRKHVIAYSRDTAGEWLRDEIQDEGEAEIQFLETSLSLAQIYEDVTLPPLKVREGEDWDAEEWLEGESD